MSVSDHDLREEVLRRMSTERLYSELRRRGTLPPIETLHVKVDVSAIIDQAIKDACGVSATTATLINQIIERDTHGKAKYGTSLDRTDLSLADWLQHQTEELLDGAGYALAAKSEAQRLLSAEEPLRKLIGHLQENPPRIHHPSLRALVDLLQ